MLLIKKFSNGSKIFFDKGKFDDWCVYIQTPDREKYAPKDTDYFARLQELSSIYGIEKVYNDFVSIYNATTKYISNETLDLIYDLSNDYGSHSTEMELLFVILYAGMIAEENKEQAILKKKIKRLGIHQVLIDYLPPKFAANYSKGKKASRLLQICKVKGF